MSDQMNLFNYFFVCKNQEIKPELFKIHDFIRHEIQDLVYFKIKVN